MSYLHTITQYLNIMKLANQHRHRSPVSYPHSHPTLRVLRGSALGMYILLFLQVTAAIDNESNKGGGGGGGGVKPALGLAWADMVTVRLMMLREEGVEIGEEQQSVSGSYVGAA